MDGLVRNTIRFTVEAWTRQFATLPVFAGEELALVAASLDGDRVIQGKFYGFGGQVALAQSHADVVERSRNMFREAVPFLLQGGGADHWVFSRSVAFLFLAGDFPTKDDFCSREAILELLHELNSPAGDEKLLGFWVCAARAKVTKEKLGELKGVHIPVKMPWM
ncbi:hypothetical protein Cgig2_017899 [Carnegiea gigantea]|uniref:Uncharacterized protein n=1 Tax=Carnegiea gigantea TaxID=171969 RepID=A0A9Q1GK57_9CARY|nr:hypothetical protein Cgig2_017899 [Carnegiea gigantea]